MEDKHIIENINYLKLLSKQFPNIASAATEIINLEAILNLPKGTEHFMSDIHGEDQAFLHILRSGSGIIRNKVNHSFNQNLTKYDKKELTTLIYYPEEFLEKVENSPTYKHQDMRDWYTVILHRLTTVLKEVSSKYTRSKVRKTLPEDFRYIIEELIYQRDNEVEDKDNYYNQIITTIITIDRAKQFIKAICYVIQQLAIDHLHIIGDITDRGPNPDKIIDKLINYHSCDIQWGNHDIVWMGANAGSIGCILTVIRNCARYGYLHILEDNYGINLIPLAKFAIDTYPEVEKIFYAKNTTGLLDDEIFMSAQINKAINILLFKYEGIISKRNPSYEGRSMLETIDYKNYTSTINGKTYNLLAKNFVTVDPKNPCKLTNEEFNLVEKLRESFMNNKRLTKHVTFLVNKGSIYKVMNNNLLFHGCIPLDEEGNYAKSSINGKYYSGKKLLDKYEKLVSRSYVNRFKSSDKDMDIFWYLWTGKNSSLFGKHIMKTFERTLILEKDSHLEEKNPYYEYIKSEDVCIKILKDFGITSSSGKIINGHVPVKVIKGENPVKANGKLIVIDGGLSKAYQRVTGIAGYTLIYNSHGMLLAAHEPFKSAKKAVSDNLDMISELSVVEIANRRILVGDTDTGSSLRQDILELKLLLDAYNKGYIKESFIKKYL